MSREIAFAIDPVSSEVEKTVAWSKENFLRKTDKIHAIMVIVMDIDFLEELIELPPVSSFQEIEEEITSEKIEAMDRIVQDLRTSGYEVVTHVFKADASHACKVLTDYFNEKVPDCIIMGSRHITGWQRYFTHSFSDLVKSRVRSPVLIV
ncbi:hypothetical protein BY458DRAFT_512006, partial [Sporodiniella umbellata]